MGKLESNVQTVRDIYAAFGRGDVPAILEKIGDDVEWEPGAIDHGIPWILPGRGRAHAAKFFQSLAGLDFKSFEVRAVMGEGDWVIGLVSLEAVVRATGKTLRETHECHVWRFDDRGRVVQMRHAADTLQHKSAAA